MAGCTLDDVLAVLKPGQSCSYNALLRRLRKTHRLTDGAGSVLRSFREGEAGDMHGELRVWLKDRMWDEEIEGGWIGVELWIARRP